MSDITRDDSVKRPSPAQWERFVNLEPEVSCWPKRFKRRVAYIPAILDRAPEVETILQMTVEVFAVSMMDLVSHRRYRGVARPRQAAMWVARKLTPLSLPDIGRAFNRDHTTVMHGIETIERLVKTDAELNGKVMTLIERVTR